MRVIITSVFVFAVIMFVLHLLTKGDKTKKNDTGIEGKSYKDLNDEYLQVIDETGYGGTYEEFLFEKYGVTPGIAG